MIEVYVPMFIALAAGITLLSIALCILTEPATESSVILNAMVFVLLFFTLGCFILSFMMWLDAFGPGDGAAFYVAIGGNHILHYTSA